MYLDGHLMYAEYETNKAYYDIVHIHTDADCAQNYGAKPQQMIHLKENGEIIPYTGELEGYEIQKWFLANIVPTFFEYD